MVKSHRASFGLIAITVVLALAILAIDLSLPLGVAAGVPYVALLVVGWRLERPRHIVLLAGIASALTIVGFLFSPEGGTLWVVLSNRMLALFVIWITAGLLAKLKNADQTVRASRERFAGILDIAPEAVISVDEDQLIRLYNQGAEAIFGYAADEVLGQPLGMLLPARFREAHVDSVESFARSPRSVIMLSDRQTIFALRKDGSEFPAEGSISKFVHDGKFVFTIMLHDITERKRTEEHLQDITRQAQAANQAKSEFLANMSHELRTPLNAIIGFSEIMKTAMLGPIGNPQYLEYAKDINQSGQHLLQVITDILDITKIEAGKFELHEEV